MAAMAVMCLTTTAFPLLPALEGQISRVSIIVWNDFSDNSISADFPSLRGIAELPPLSIVPAAVFLVLREYERLCFS